MSRLTGSSPSRWLSITRWVVLGCILLIMINQVVSLPERYQLLRLLEPGSGSATAFYGWTTTQIHQLAQIQGLHPEFIAGLIFSASLFCLLCYWLMGGLLLWRKSDTWEGLLISYILFATGPGFSNLYLTEAQGPGWLNRFTLLLATITWPTFFVLLYLFPNGKFVPPFTRYLAILPYLLFLTSSFVSRMEAPLIIILLAYAFGGLFSQVYRYRRVSASEERQQTKWVVFGIGLFISTLPIFFIIPVLFPALIPGTSAGFWWEFIGNGVVGILIPALLPLTIEVSIMRYRLWDIDIIIRRTLVYGALTILLGLAYFGGVVVLQGLLTFGQSIVTTRQSPIVIVTTTLSIAALFNPLRRRIQDFIDRRFYRRKYDAEKALAAFAKAARSETDLEQLSAQLTDTLQEALQPEHISLWLNSNH